MSPAPTKTGSVLAVVWNVQVGPVTAVWVASLTVAYHWNVWPPPRLAQALVVESVFDVTFVFWRDLGVVPARERPAEEGDGQRIAVGVADVHAQGRRGAGARRGVRGQRRGRAHQERCCHLVRLRVPGSR